MRQIFGVILLIVGVAYFAFHGFHYTAEHKVLDIGPIQASAESEKELLPYSPLVGSVIVAGGVVLLIAGSIRKAG